MGIHVGVNGTPKEVVGVYVGVNGTPKECSDVYVGVNGTPKSCYSGVKPGETIFTSSSTFTVPKGVKKIDVFCVGGGSGAMNRTITKNGEDLRITLGYGGNGGYTNTMKNIAVTPGQQLSVVVGNGGWQNSHDGDKCGGTSQITIGNTSVIANGAGDNTIRNDYYNTGKMDVGGSGGAGSIGVIDYLAYCEKYEYYPSENVCKNGINNGGKDGGNGDLPNGVSNVPATWIRHGQGTTTRYFGESTGTLYASGGRSLGSERKDINIPQFNTGDGVDGGGYMDFNHAEQYATPYANFYYWTIKGGSGICIIRWGK